MLRALKCCVPVQQSFAERVYLIDYPGPEISLQYHYDCNDEHDFKCQILLEKSEGAPSLSYVRRSSGSHDTEEPFEEDRRNLCIFHPHSTYHGIRKGHGRRRVLMLTFTTLKHDRRPIVCHADLISRWRPRLRPQCT